jgi:hypothetical protein
MAIKKTVPVVFTRPGAAVGTTPFVNTAGRFFGLDAGDWLTMLAAIALVGALLALV